MAGKWEWEDHLCQVLLTKPAEVVQEAVEVLEEHGCHVKKEQKSELSYGTVACTLCRVVYTAHLAVSGKVVCKPIHTLQY